MPRRKDYHPLVTRIGQRFQELRKEANRTLNTVTKSKGYVSQFENGVALPSLINLDRLAEALEMDLVDVVNRPERSLRNQLIERTRKIDAPRLRQLLALTYCDKQTWMQVAALTAKDRFDNQTRYDEPAPRPEQKSRNTEQRKARSA